MHMYIVAPAIALLAGVGAMVCAIFYTRKVRRRRLEIKAMMHRH